MRRGGEARKRRGRKEVRRGVEEEEIIECSIQY